VCVCVCVCVCHHRVALLFVGISVAFEKLWVTVLPRVLVCVCVCE